MRFSAEKKRIVVERRRFRDIFACHATVSQSRDSFVLNWKQIVSRIASS